MSRSDLAGLLGPANGSQRSFQPSVNRRIAAVSSRTESKEPRRMACRAMTPKKISVPVGKHPGHIQVPGDDHLVAAGQVADSLVRRVGPDVRDSRVAASKLGCSFGPAAH